MEIVLLSLARSVSAASEVDDGMWPSLPGIDTTTAKCRDVSHEATSPNSILIPMGSRRVERTASDCGWVLRSTKTESDFDLLTL